MNTKNLFALDFTKSSIAASATTLRKARNPESPECKALMRMLSEHPSFHVAEKEINKKDGKQTYKGLTFQAMTDYIKTQANSEAEIRKYEVVRHIAKIKGSEYALTKKWFLNAYASGIQTNGYSIVRNWFVAQFPLYRKEPLFYLTGEHMVLSAADFLKKQEAMKQSA